MPNSVSSGGEGWEGGAISLVPFGPLPARSWWERRRGHLPWRRRNLPMRIPASVWCRRFSPLPSSHRHESHRTPSARVVRPAVGSLSCWPASQPGLQPARRRKPTETWDAPDDQANSDASPAPKQSRKSRTKSVPVARVAVTGSHIEQPVAGRNGEAARLPSRSSRRGTSKSWALPPWDRRCCGRRE
jgi:hypothetical protein